MIDDDFLQIFLDEADEILERWEASCLTLEKSPSSDELNSLFRSAHNLKGSSKSVGLLEFGGFVHKVEDVITELKSGKLNVTPEVIGLILECQNQLVLWIKNLRDNPQALLDCNALSLRLAQHVIGKEAESLSYKPPAEDLSAGFGFFSDDPPSAPVNPKDLGTILVENGMASPHDIELGLAKQNRKLGSILVEEGLVSKEHVETAL